MDDIKTLLNYASKNRLHQKAYDYWIFSYLCNGMNMADITRLKKENIEGDFFVSTGLKPFVLKEGSPARSGSYPSSGEGYH